MPETPAITGIAHIEFSVRDLDRSVDFYCRLLGARDVFRGRDNAEGISDCAIREPRSGLVLAFTRHDAVEAEPFSPRRAGLDHASFAVAEAAELEAWVTHLDALGIAHSPVNDYGYALALTCADPDGIALEWFWSKPR
jgi:glyoxylase I family protein